HSRLQQSLHHHHSPITPHSFFNDTAPTEIYTLSLHDALPIYEIRKQLPDATSRVLHFTAAAQEAGTTTVLLNLAVTLAREGKARDRKSTRLNSSHVAISYAVFCLKKKNSKSRALRHALTRSYL